MKQINPMVLLLILTISCSPSKDDKNPEQKKMIYKNEVDSLLNLMTLEEKVGQMVQYSGGWDLTGPASSNNNKQKEQQIKKDL